MRICAIGAAALIALCLAGGAQAKGPNYARACGASGCTTIRGTVVVQRLLDWMGATFTVAEKPKRRRTTASRSATTGPRS